MRNEPNFQKSQMFITSIKTTNYNEKQTMDSWSKQTQTKPNTLVRHSLGDGGSDERLTSQRYRHLLSSQVLDPELTWRHPYKSLECSRKIALIIIADLKTNFRAVLRRSQQQLLRPLYPNAGQVIYKSDTHLLFEYMGQPGNAHV